jgi:hypothetical protein
MKRSPQGSELNYLNYGKELTIKYLEELIFQKRRMHTIVLKPGQI